MHYINSKSFTNKLGKPQILFDKLSRSLLTKWFLKMENSNLLKGNEKWINIHIKSIKCPKDKIG
jgi:hypothetical protein